jgi:hypothetical protein
MLARQVLYHLNHSASPENDYNYKQVHNDMKHRSGKVIDDEATVIDDFLKKVN